MAAADRLRQRTAEWWSKRSEQIVHEFLADPQTEAPVPGDSYLRLWLADMFVADARSRAKDRYAALRASVRLNFAGSEGTMFSTMVGPAAGQGAPGLRSAKLTGLLPFAGGTVSVQANLYQVDGRDDLRLAMDILGGFSSLLVAPLGAVASIAERVATGIDKVEAALDHAGREPLLTLDKEYAGAGSRATPLQPGYQVVVNAPVSELDTSRLSMIGGRLLLNGTPLSGYDYLVVEIQVLKQRDDWKFPEWDRMIREAHAARARGERKRAKRLKTDLTALIVSSGDLTPVDGLRLAKLVADELDSAVSGAAESDTPGTVDEMVAVRGLPSPREVAGLNIADLLD